MKRTKNTVSSTGSTELEMDKIINNPPLKQKQKYEKKSNALERKAVSASLQM